MPLHRVFGFLLPFVLVLANVSTVAAQAQPDQGAGGAQVAEPQAALDVPDMLVGPGVHSFYLSGSKVFWDSNPDCPSQPTAMAADLRADLTANTAAIQLENAGFNLAPDSANAPADPVTIQRIRTLGGTTRLIFNKNDPRNPGVCNPYGILSNIVADDNYLYWLDTAGLQKLSVEANPGDAPTQLMPSFWSNTSSLQLTIGPDTIYGIADKKVWRAAKDSPSSGFEIRSFTAQPRTLRYYNGSLYYILAGNLRRLNPVDNTVQDIDLSGQVMAYTYDATKNWLFVGVGPSVFAWDLTRNGWVMTQFIPPFGPPPTPVRFFTSGDNVTINPLVRAMTTDGNFLFVFDQRTANCGLLACSSYNHLVRVFVGYDSTIGWFGAGAGDLFVFDTANNNFLDAAGPSNLTTDNQFLFFQVLGAVLRLPNNAAALSSVNMRAVGYEITQGIQRGDNSVVLVQNRDTFVRVFVQSDGAPVPDVSALLYGILPGGQTIGPISPSNGRITVPSSPGRLDYDQQFVFQLPYQWTQQPGLRLEFQLNKYRLPPEPVYYDNVLDTKALDFKPSPRLDLIFAEFSYKIGGATFKPQGLLSNVSWIKKAYPLGYTIKNGEWQPGLNYQVWDIQDSNDALSRRVQRLSPECAAFVTYNSDKTIKQDDRELCASNYTNSLLASLRSARKVPDGTFIYGEIPDSSSAGGQFPRGQAGGSKVSSGPDGATWSGFYAGHEVGHTIGGGHPLTGDKECNLDGSDSVPPYPHGHIGPDDDTINGFYPYWTKVGSNWQAGAILKGSGWTDVMAYCRDANWPYQWISDQNYERFYNNIPKPTQVAAAAVTAPLAGDFLSAYGSIAPDGSGASLTQVRRYNTVDNIPPIVAGGYALRLRNAADAQLAEYAFTPAAGEDGWLPFGQVVNFVAGARKVEIVRLADNTVLASQAVSPNPPVVTGVAAPAVAAADADAVTLSWSASDPDNDALTYDVLYSRDGGITFQPVLFRVTVTSATIDTSMLGGSTKALFQVIASDGVNTGFANSPQFTLAARPPRVQILGPADGLRVHWGTPVNFSGVAVDMQDGSLSGASLVWSNQKGVLGTGPLLSTDALPTGVNNITLQATNSQGLTGSASITVVVDDDLSAAGPQLSLAPNSVTWNLPSGISAPQTAKIALANSGGGTVTWQASSDQGWLTLDAAQGSLPATVTLTGNPAGLPDGDNRATMTFQALNGAAKVVHEAKVLVTLRIGDPGYGVITESPPVGEGTNQLFMPLLRR